MTAKFKQIEVSTISIFFRQLGRSTAQVMVTDHHSPQKQKDEEYFKLTFKKH